MWIAIIFATIMSMVGYQSLIVQAAVPPTHDAATAQALAADMATYRFAVVAYANDNPTVTGTVADTALHFPTGYIAPNPAMWSNMIYIDGTIAIFAARTAPVGLTSAINRLAGASPMLVQPNATTFVSRLPPTASLTAVQNAQGQFVGQNNAFALTTTPVTLAAQAIIASLPTTINNVPVWFAHRG